jgi:SAM-dependent methyltransferase
LSITDDLRAQADAWRARPLLRRIYADWFELVGSRLSLVDGKTVELGTGIGEFKARFPAVVATDVEQTPWTDAVVDAERMPFDDGTLANLVLIDVFHHLADPAAFFDEARRTLRVGGRVVILDPYCSPVSTIAYQRFHHERTDLHAPPFERDPRVGEAAFASNQARSTLVFYRHVQTFRTRWPDLTIVDRRRLSFIAYPLSGGFSKRRFSPAALYPLLSWFERVLAPAGSLAAFRCLVVLELSRRSARGVRAGNEFE